jgi:hypothetical protein
MNDALNKSVIERHEGRRLVVYLDGRGFKSIAVGFNLEAAGAGAICARAGLKLDALLAGQVISPATCDVLFELLYEPVAKDARSIFPAIDSYPENAAAVICDMRFELGVRAEGLAWCDRGHSQFADCGRGAEPGGGQHQAAGSDTGLREDMRHERFEN